MPLVKRDLGPIQRKICSPAESARNHHMQWLGSAQIKSLSQNVKEFLKSLNRQFRFTTLKARLTIPADAGIGVIPARLRACSQESRYEKDFSGGVRPGGTHLSEGPAPGLRADEAQGRDHDSQSDDHHRHGER